MVISTSLFLTTIFDFFYTLSSKSLLHHQVYSPLCPEGFHKGVLTHLTLMAWFIEHFIPKNMQFFYGCCQYFLIYGAFQKRDVWNHLLGKMKNEFWIWLHPMFTCSGIVCKWVYFLIRSRISCTLKGAICPNLLKTFKSLLKNVKKWQFSWTKMSMRCVSMLTC